MCLLSSFSWIDQGHEFFNFDAASVSSPKTRPDDQGVEITSCHEAWEENSAWHFKKITLLPFPK